MDQILPRLLPIGALGICLLAFASEASGFRAKTLAFRPKLVAAKGQASQDRAKFALQCADQALALNPDEPEALFSRAVSLKELNRWDDLGAMLPRALASHPNQASVRRLTGEAAFRRGDANGAADLLWEALWINPTPPYSATSIWRMTMLASFAAGRQPEALAAAIRAIGLMETDPLMRPEERKDLLSEAAEVFKKQGWTLPASHLEALAGRKKEK